MLSITFYLNIYVFRCPKQAMLIDLNPLHQKLEDRLNHESLKQVYLYLRVRLLSLIVGLIYSPLYADTSELSIGIGSRVNTPIQNQFNYEDLGLTQQSFDLATLVQLGISQAWHLGTELSVRRSPLTPISVDPGSVPSCSFSLPCHPSTYVSEGHTLDLKLRGTYQPLDWISPIIWGGGGLWKRWRNQAYELIGKENKTSLSYQLKKQQWWGYHLAIGTGLYWRFASKWSTILGLELELQRSHKNILKPALNDLYIGVSLWLNYHQYLRLI